MPTPSSRSSRKCHINNKADLQYAQGLQTRKVITVQILLEVCTALLLMF